MTPPIIVPIKVNNLIISTVTPEILRIAFPTNIKTLEKKI